MKKFLHSAVLALTLLSSPALFAQDANSGASSPDNSAGSGDTSGGGNGQRGEKWREAFAKLDLTDAQKEQVRQIRSSTSPGRERRQQIMAVLTPAQKEQLVAMIRQYRANHSGQ